MSLTLTSILSVSSVHKVDRAVRRRHACYAKSSNCRTRAEAPSSVRSSAVGQRCRSGGSPTARWSASEVAELRITRISIQPFPVRHAFIPTDGNSHGMRPRSFFDSIFICTCEDVGGPLRRRQEDHRMAWEGKTRAPDAMALDRVSSLRAKSSQTARSPHGGLGRRRRCL